MASEKLYPDGVVFSTNLVGSYTDIDDDPDLSASDADYLTTLGDGSYILRASFPTPSGNPTSTQTFAFRVRATSYSGEGDPLNVELYENGVLTQDLGSVELTYTTLFEKRTVEWSASSLNTADGSAVEIRLEGGELGPPSQRHAWEISALAWEVEYEEGSVSAALTGQSVTSSVGSPGVGARSAGLTGSAVATADEDPVASLSPALSGQSATAAAGSVSAETVAEAALTGLSVDSASGGPSLSRFVPVVGLSASADHGSPPPVALPAVSGEAVVTVGGVVVSATEPTLVGWQASSSTGALAAPWSVLLTGGELETAGGSLQVSIGGQIILQGQVIYTGSGGPTPPRSAPLSGASVAAQGGFVALVRSSATTGRSVASAAGEVLLPRSIALTPAAPMLAADGPPSVGGRAAALSGTEVSALPGQLGVSTPIAYKHPRFIAVG